MRVLPDGADLAELCNSLAARADRYGSAAALSMAARLEQVATADDWEELALLPGVQVAVQGEAVIVQFARDGLAFKGRTRSSEGRTGDRWDFILTELTVVDARIMERGGR